jgi:transposase
MKQRIPDWRSIRQHHVVPDKRYKTNNEIELKLARTELSLEMNFEDGCPWCGSIGRVEVHGHTQCTSCHHVIDDCCQGGYCDN